MTSWFGVTYVRYVLYSHMPYHNDTIIKTQEDFFNKICTSHFICNVCVWEGVGNRTETAIFWPPLLWPSALCLSRSPDAQPESQGLSFLLAFSTASYQQLLRTPTHRGSKSPFGLMWPSLPHLVYNSISNSNCLTSVLTELYNSSPSTQSPTRSLKWHVWSSSSGNNCHAVHRSLSSGTSVYECTMGIFYLVRISSANFRPRDFLS